MYAKVLEGCPNLEDGVGRPGLITFRVGRSDNIYTFWWSRRPWSLSSFSLLQVPWPEPPEM